MDCAWCANPNAEGWDESLCLDHQAEYEGVTVDQLERRDRDQYAEYLDTLGR